MANESRLLLCFICLGLSQLSPSEIRANDPKTHILLVIDSTARNAEVLGIPLDGLRMLKAIKSLPSSLKNNINYTVFSGDQATPDAVRSYYQRLNSGPLDTLIFYYTGHGGMTGKEPRDLMNIPLKPSATGRGELRPYLDPTDHLFTMAAGNLRRMEVESLMKQRLSRLNLIIGDCCGGFPREVARSKDRGLSSSELEAASESQDSTGLALSHSPKLNPELWIKLVNENVGVIHIAATPIGINARGDMKNGGHLTCAIVAMLEADAQTLDPLFSPEVYEKHMTWGHFVSYAVKHYHRKHFLKPDNPNQNNISSQVVSEIGPLQLSVNDPGHAYAPEMFYDSQYKMLFASNPKGDRAGFVCRVMPGSPFNLEPGYYEVNSVNATEMNTRNSRDLYRDFAISRSGKTIVLYKPMTSGAVTADNRELRIRFP